MVFYWFLNRWNAVLKLLIIYRVVLNMTLFVLNMTFISHFTVLYYISEGTKVFLNKVENVPEVILFVVQVIFYVKNNAVHVQVSC